MTKIDLTPFEQAAETERRLAHERIERLEAEVFWWRVGGLFAGLAVALAVLV